MKSAIRKYKKKLPQQARKFSWAHRIRVDPSAKTDADVCAIWGMFAEFNTTSSNGDGGLHPVHFTPMNNPCLSIRWFVSIGWTSLACNKYCSLQQRRHTYLSKRKAAVVLSQTFIKISQDFFPRDPETARVVQFLRPDSVFSFTQPSSDGSYTHSQLLLKWMGVKAAPKGIFSPWCPKENEKASMFSPEEVAFSCHNHLLNKHSYLWGWGVLSMWVPACFGAVELCPPT